MTRLQLVTILLKNKNTLINNLYFFYQRKENKTVLFLLILIIKSLPSSQFSNSKLQKNIVNLQTNWTFIPLSNPVIFIPLSNPVISNGGGSTVDVDVRYMFTNIWLNRYVHCLVTLFYTQRSNYLLLTYKPHTHVLLLIS